MSQVSPDGQYVVTTITGPDSDVAEQPTTSPISRTTASSRCSIRRAAFWPGTAGPPAERQPLPGADDPRYVQTDGVWSPDGKYLVFARAEAKDPYPAGQKLAEYANDPNETPDPVRPLPHSLQRRQGRQAGADRRRFAERHEQHLSQGLARRPLDRLRAVPQRPVDASRQPALHRPGGRRAGAAHALQHAADELLAQLFAQRPLAGLLLQEPLALHADVSDAHRRRTATTARPF